MTFASTIFKRFLSGFPRPYSTQMLCFHLAARKLQVRKSGRASRAKQKTLAVYVNGDGIVPRDCHGKTPGLETLDDSWDPNCLLVERSGSGFLRFRVGADAALSQPQPASRTESRRPPGPDDAGGKSRATGK